MSPAARGARRLGRILLAVLLSPVLLATVLVALPAIAVLELRRAVTRARVRRTFEARWGRHGMRVVLAYSDDTRWRERIERDWLPRIGRRTVVLDSRSRQTFRRDAPVEAQVFEHWAGRRDFDPIAIVIPHAGRVRTFGFRDAFLAAFAGDDRPLAAAEARLFGLVESLRQPGGVAAPADALRMGTAARRDA